MIVLVDNVGVFLTQLLDLVGHHVFFFINDHANCEVR